MIEYLHEMKNQQLAERILSYINRTETLQKQVLDILDNRIAPFNKEAIMNEYKAIKNALRDDSREIQCKEFYNLTASDDLKRAFYSRITDTAIRGYKCRVGAKIDFSFFSSIAQALDYLTDNKSKDEWKKLAEGYKSTD
jgi:hypothetical protein